MTLFKRLRSFFQKPEDSPSRTIALDDIPFVLEEQERAIEMELRGVIAPHREAILDALERIREILNGMESKERDPAWHPKLEKIGKTALPNFIRSMQQILDRPLPPSPSVEFYQEAAGVLKSCIRAMKGAGKYLPMIFPDEMKALRQEIRKLGQAINAITLAVSEREQDHRTIEELHQEYTVHSSAQSHLQEVRTAYEKMQEQHAGAESRVAVLLTKKEGITRSADYTALEGDRERLLALEREAREIHLKNEGILGAILSLHRRAERVAHRNDDPGRGAIAETIQVLESAAALCDELEGMLDGSLPLVRRFIEKGDLILKGHEEGRIFGQGHSPVEEAKKACREMARIDGMVAEMRARLAAAPLQQQIKQLEREMADSEEACQRYRRELDQMNVQLESIPRRIRSHRENMDRMLSRLLKGEVRLLNTHEIVKKV